MKNYIVALFVVALAGCGVQRSLPAMQAAPDVSNAFFAPRTLPVTPFNAPASVFPNVATTEPTGIRDGLVTATVSLQGGATMGGLYLVKGKKWAQLNYPNASSTAAYGPRVWPGGYYVVGSYKKNGVNGDSGFVYDSSTKTFKTVNAPKALCKPKACNYTIAHSVYGTKNYLMVGNYDAVVPPPANAAAAAPVSGHAFLYDSKNAKFSTIDVPNTASTTAYGIWIDGPVIAIAGGYADKTGTHAYVRDLGGKHFVKYDYPKTALTHFEGITGAGGAGNYNVIGDYTAVKGGKSIAYGFFLEIRNWKVFLQPVVIGALSANSVQSRTVIGVYKNNGSESGYTVTIPVQDPPRSM